MAALNIRLDEELKVALQEIAATLDLPVSYIVRQALKAYVEKYNNQKEK